MRITEAGREEERQGQEYVQVGQTEQRCEDGGLLRNTEAAWAGPCGQPQRGPSPSPDLHISNRSHEPSGRPPGPCQPVTDCPLTGDGAGVRGLNGDQDGGLEGPRAQDHAAHVLSRVSRGNPVQPQQRTVGLSATGEGQEGAGAAPSSQPPAQAGLGPGVEGRRRWGSLLYLVPGGEAATTFVPRDLGMGLPRDHAVQIQRLPFGHVRGGGLDADGLGTARSWSSTGSWGAEKLVSGRGS